MGMSLARACKKAWLLSSCLALFFLVQQPAHAQGAPPAPEFKTLLKGNATGQVLTYYVNNAPLWTDSNGSLNPAAGELVQLIETADDDGLDPAALHARELADAVNAAQTNPNPTTNARAEILLSSALASYVAALRNPSGQSMEYEASTLKPQRAMDYYTLVEAAKAPSLSQYIHDMPWMHPLYGQLRHAMMDNTTLSPTQRATAVANLERLRQIPAQPNGRHILIDAASATLFMYEGNRVVDSMKVIVGKAATQTPIYAGYVRYAMLNPYWNVPDNLVQSLIAKNVLAQGVKYLKRQGYEVVDGWEDGAKVLDPLTIDWAAARRGDLPLHVRQLPSTFNSMGKVKYEFPNVHGIYLHDTPEKDLMEKDVRQLSNGCIRLEDAKRLGRWLMEGDISQTGDAPEQKVELPQPVPIYITYLTARPEGGQLAFGPDPYSHDHVALASAAAD